MMRVKTLCADRVCYRQLPVKMEYDTTLAEKAYALATRWDKSRGLEASTLPFSAQDLDGFSSNQTGIVSVLE
jgi:leukotriene-A4 hydrolase